MPWSTGWWTSSAACAPRSPAPRCWPGWSPTPAPALALAQDGAVVGVIGRRRDRLAEVLADCHKTSPESTMWVADLADSASVGPLAQQAAEALGAIDVLVNNAAIPKRRLVTALEP